MNDVANAKFVAVISKNSPMYIIRLGLWIDYTGTERYLFCLALQSFE